MDRSLSLSLCVYSVEFIIYIIFVWGYPHKNQFMQNEYFNCVMRNGMLCSMLYSRYPTTHVTFQLYNLNSHKIQMVTNDPQWNAVGSHVFFGHGDFWMYVMNLTGVKSLDYRASVTYIQKGNWKPSKLTQIHKTKVTELRLVFQSHIITAIFLAKRTISQHDEKRREWCSQIAIDVGIFKDLCSTRSTLGQRTQPTVKLSLTFSKCKSSC